MESGEELGFAAHNMETKILLMVKMRLLSSFELAIYPKNLEGVLYIS